MKKLKSIELRNFQKHGRIKIDLDPKITTIVGPSDEGKSSIVRAARFVIANQPSGNAFITDGKKKTTVTMSFGKSFVKRVKGLNRENKYVIRHRRKKHILESFGRGVVPDEVQALLRLSPEINIQQQHDAPFWLHLSPPEVSRQLNKIVNIDQMDVAMSKVASIIRESNSKLSVIEERITEHTKRKKQLDFTVDAKKSFDNILQISKNLQTIQEDIEKLKGFVSDIKEQKGKIDTKSIPSTSHIESAMQTSDKLNRTYNQLQSLVSQAVASEKRVSETKAIVTKLKSELKAIGEICPTCGQRIK